MLGRFSPRSQETWHAIADRLDRIAALETTGSPDRRLIEAIASLETAGTDAGRRASQRHAATGLPTREPLIARMLADGRGILAVVRFLDHDRLSAFDPALADQLLAQVGSRLAGMLPADRMLCQIDRAHLALWFSPDLDEASARREFAAIEYALDEPLGCGEHTVVPTISSLLARHEGPGAASTLSKALAQLAVSGGTGLVTSEQVLLAEGRERFSLEQDLRLAMPRRELRLCYQPLIDAAEGRVFGAEALMRWNNPIRGPVSPADFIPVMEAIGLASEAGVWALNTAVREASRWALQGFKGLRVAVNVSGRQLDQDNLYQQIDRALRRHEQSPEVLEIELTETVAMGDSERAAQLLSRIRSLGVTIAIDDFGTGYSSLSALRKLSFDKIKIDREFVTDVHNRTANQAICQSIIALARGLGIRVLAEGVECAEEYIWLREHGCDRFQGFYFSRPLEAADFSAFLADRAELEARLAVGPRAMLRSLTDRLAP